MKKYPLFFLMSAFLLRFKVNYLEKMSGYPNASLWILIAFAKICLSVWGFDLLICLGEVDSMNFPFFGTEGFPSSTKQKQMSSFCSIIWR